MRENPDQALELTSDLVPLFVITNGRGLPPEHEYSHTTLVTAQEGAPARALSPEAREVMDLVSDGFLSVAEVAGHTHLPLGIVRILLARMEDDGLIFVRPPTPRAELPDRELLQAVIDGLHASLKTPYGA
ncbi:DUF742 domain-containing protein [Streptomyces pluripotens]|uniref:DUF742 domain-containing protein n=1 Tax=Streptomyces pluripotens TaxID=1355015 RepID=A0A221P0J0_9ACTN|nr:MULTISPECIES: DUF742 domain-containing protein [Streptomyces]ARP71033.1 hypothetical protein LK06_014885 [Streptomyces pluripotens]ASN25285.1 DUF742 domain-containing protein [Streptomyces pluripotens]KIE25922.1 hypothetical protein LK08_15915 [Streptomyces sp. MUSC 125]MCH0557203.1 DUF742 domain-containing protein [Streptomyces sp. MUM 16J]